MLIGAARKDQSAGALHKKSSEFGFCYTRSHTCIQQIQHVRHTPTVIYARGNHLQVDVCLAMRLTNTAKKKSTLTKCGTHPCFGKKCCRSGHFLRNVNNARRNFLAGGCYLISTALGA